jgi:hypothetical protein
VWETGSGAVLALELFRLDAAIAAHSAGMPTNRLPWIALLMSRESATVICRRRIVLRQSAEKCGTAGAIGASVPFASPSAVRPRALGHIALKEAPQGTVYLRLWLGSITFEFAPQMLTNH